MTEDRERRIREALHGVLHQLSAESVPLDLVEDIPILEAFVDDYADARIADARSSGAVVVRYRPDVGGVEASGSQAVHGETYGSATWGGDRAALHTRQGLTALLPGLPAFFDTGLATGTQSA